MKAVLIRKSTQEVIKKGNYPNRKMNPIEGLDADLEWLLVVNLPNPSYDPMTHKLVQYSLITDTPNIDYPHLNNYEIGTQAVAMNEVEIAEYVQKTEDEDNATQTQLNHKENGIILFDRFFAIVIRKNNNGVITNDQAKLIAEFMYDSLEPLYKGLWQITKVKIGELTPPSNAKLLTLFNFINDKVNDYINENY